MRYAENFRSLSKWLFPRMQAAFAGVNPGITGLGLNCTRGWEILEGLLSEAP